MILNMIVIIITDETISILRVFEDNILEVPFAVAAAAEVVVESSY